MCSYFIIHTIKTYIHASYKDFYLDAKSTIVLLCNGSRCTKIKNCTLRPHQMSMALQMIPAMIAQPLATSPTSPSPPNDSDIVDDLTHRWDKKHRDKRGTQLATASVGDRDSHLLCRLPTDYSCMNSDAVSSELPWRIWRGVGITDTLHAVLKTGQGARVCGSPEYSWKWKWSQAKKSWYDTFRQQIMPGRGLQHSIRKVGAFLVPSYAHFTGCPKHGWRRWVGCGLQWCCLVERLFTGRSGEDSITSRKIARRKRLLETRPPCTPPDQEERAYTVLEVLNLATQTAVDRYSMRV